MMVEDAELERKCGDQNVSRSVKESKSRMGFTRARLLYWVGFESAKDRDEHMIEIAVHFALSGRSILLKVDGEPVVKKTGKGLFEYGWARRGHAYLVRERERARPDDYDVFELLVDDKTYKSGGGGGGGGGGTRSRAERKAGDAATDSDDSDHGRGRDGKDSAADAKQVRHFTFNHSPKALPEKSPAARGEPEAPAPSEPKRAPPRHWRLNRPGEAKAISNRIEVPSPKAPTKDSGDADGSEDGDAYETRLCELIGAADLDDDNDDDDDAFASDVKAFTRLVSSPSRREGGGFYSLLSEVRQSEFV